MLNFFRQKGLTNAIYGVIIVGMILIFVLQFNPSAGKKLGTVSEACAARVHGSCIEPKAHRASYRVLFARGTGPMKASQASHLVLEGMIERELLVAEAQRLGLTVTEDEITDSIFKSNILVSLPGEQFVLERQMGIEDGKVPAPFKDPKTKQFDMKTYERQVKAITGRSPQEFREWQSRELLAQKMRDLVKAPVRIADEEALDRFKAERSTATLGYAAVRRSWVEKYAVSADPKELEVWAKDKVNLGPIKSPVSHILISFPGDKKPPAPTPEEKEATKKKAQEILDRVKKGEDFAKLAKEFSGDPGSKDKGGQYPGEDVEHFVPEFKKAYDSVPPGTLVPELVETMYGFHIIKRDDVTKEQIVTQYKVSKGLDVAKLIAAKIISEVKAGKSGEDAVKTAIAQFGTVKPAAEKKPENANVKGGSGSGADAGAGKNTAAADAGAPTEPAPVVFTADTDPERPQYNSTSPFSRGGNPIPGVSGEPESQVLAYAFSAAKPGEVRPEPIRTDEGFLAVVLKDVKAATKADFDKERDEYEVNILLVKQGEAFANYTRRLRESHKDDVKIDENNVMGAKSDAGAASSPAEDDEGP